MGTQNSLPLDIIVITVPSSLLLLLLLPYVYYYDHHYCDYNFWYSEYFPLFFYSVNFTLLCTVNGITSFLLSYCKFVQSSSCCSLVSGKQWRSRTFLFTGETLRKTRVHDTLFGWVQWFHFRAGIRVPSWPLGGDQRCRSDGKVILNIQTRAHVSVDLFMDSWSLKGVLHGRSCTNILGLYAYTVKGTQRHRYKRSMVSPTAPSLPFANCLVYARPRAKVAWFSACSPDTKIVKTVFPSALLPSCVGVLWFMNTLVVLSFMAILFLIWYAFLI